MPPVDQPKADPLNRLLDEVEMLSAQASSLGISLKRAHTDALEEVEKFQQQFRAKVISLKAELEERDNDQGIAREDLTSIQNEDLLRRLAEQQNLIQHGHEESERRGAAIVALREQLSRLETANRELEQSAALRVEQAQQELRSQVTQIQAELAQKEEAFRQLHMATSQTAQSAQATVRPLEEDLASSRESANRQQTEGAFNESEHNELCQRLAELESTREQVKAAAERDMEALRHTSQAKIAALQSEIAHKTALLTQNQSTIARLERAIQANSGASRSTDAETQSVLEQQAAEIEALRAELEQKQLLLEQRQGVQDAEQELRNRNRELQGRLAAKESVIESQEYHLRNAQRQLLATRDALDEKERALAEWQARATEQEQHFHAQRNEWQSRWAETEPLIERYSGEVERTREELAAALERHRELLQEYGAMEQRVQQLSAQVDELARQLNERQAMLDRQDEMLRHSQAREAELSGALAETRDALAMQQASARSLEQDFTTQVAELRLELERNAAALRERDGVASRAEPDFRAQIADLQTQLQEKDRVLEARAHEIGILQARVESLSGQAARLEEAQKQALADASDETRRTRQALQTEIAALQSTSDQQQALLEERRAALAEIEQTLRAEIEALKERSAGQQTLLEKQSAEMGGAVEEAHSLHERLAQMQNTAHHADEVATRRLASDAMRIAELEQELQSTQQKLAQREAALAHAEQRLQNSAPGSDAAHPPVGAEDQSTQLVAAQDKIAELLERLAQLEAARNILQENAAHELQQLRESFETRITKLRMELAAKEQAQPQKSPPADNQVEITALEEGFQKRIQELQGQLAEQRTLLENRNEELIKVKAELDALQDHVAQLNSSHAQESMDETRSVELREEDAVEPLHFVNGSVRPDPLDMRGADAVGQDPGGVVASNRLAQLEGRVRSWHPQLEKESAFGSGRRWNIGVFKRRWKA